MPCLCSARTSPTSRQSWLCGCANLCVKFHLHIADGLHIPEWLDHAVREAVQDVKGPLFIASPYATKLDDIATTTYRAAPDDLARLGFAVAHSIDATAPEVAELSSELETIIAEISAALLGAKRPLIVSGKQAAAVHVSLKQRRKLHGRCARQVVRANLKFHDARVQQLWPRADRTAAALRGIPIDPE